MAGSKVIGIRFRVQPFTCKFILEVQLAFGDGPGDSNGMPDYLAGTVWTDARLEHMAEVFAIINPQNLRRTP